MYTLIYNFFYNDLFSNTSLNSMESTIMGVSIKFDEWLSHSMTIITLVLIFILFVIISKWLFKVFSGIILLK